MHLAGWPAPGEPDVELLAEIAELRRVVELGRQARAASGVKLRQPLRALVVDGAPRAQSHADEIADELRVRDVSFGEVEASKLRVKPNLRVLGPKLGKELGAVRAALEAGEFEELEAGGFRAAGHELSREEVLVERHGRDGWAVAALDGVTVALGSAPRRRPAPARPGLRPHPLRERKRKELGLELTDRIRLTIPEADAVCSSTASGSPVKRSPSRSRRAGPRSCSSSRSALDEAARLVGFLAPPAVDELFRG